MKLIAQKPCSFGGKKFYIDDEIPAELVLSPEEQKKMGVLAIVEDETVTDEPKTGEVKVDKVTITVHGEAGDAPLNLTMDGLQSVFDVLTAKAADAEPIVQKMTDPDALVLLNLSDSRKSIKAAAEARVQALDVESEGEQ